MTCFAKAVSCQHVFNGGNSFCLGLGDDDTLARSQSVSLHHNRCALGFDIGDGGFYFSKILIGGGGNIMTCKKVLGKCLGTFQLCSALGGAKNA